MKSLVIETGKIELPLLQCEKSMIPFSLETLEGLPKEFRYIASSMLVGLTEKLGTGFFTIHGKKLKKGETLRRGGPHTDGNYEQHCMTFGGGGWKVGQDGPGVNTDLHQRQYAKNTGGIILASNYEACNGWIGEYDGSPGVGGDCAHLRLDQPFRLKSNKIYYGNNHFIHESLPMEGDTHRVFARITLPEDHQFNTHQAAPEE